MDENLSIPRDFLTCLDPRFPLRCGFESLIILLETLDFYGYKSSESIVVEQGITIGNH